LAAREATADGRAARAEKANVLVNASPRPGKAARRLTASENAGDFGTLTAVAVGSAGEGSRAEAAADVACTVALAPQRKGKSAKGEADMTISGKADAAGRAATLVDPTAGSPITKITVSSRSGGEKVTGIDTMKVGPKSGEAGASIAALPSGYRPSDSEPFMNDRQRLYFRNKLIAWKEEIVRQNRETLQGLHEDSAQHADVADRATFETDRALELRARDRQRKLIAKIDSALARIEDGSYGYCEETGEPISLKRLDARPIATLSIEAQERHERRERVFREE
jgi:DnaK suppressor protein